jgi:hypothetical protein
MFLINEQMYISLEDQIDLPALELIKKDIVLGIAKSKRYIRDAGAGSSNCLDQDIPSILDYGIKSKIEDPNGPYYNYFKKLNFVRDDCLTFIKYIEKTQQMGQALNLRSFIQQGNMQQKSSSIHTKATPAYGNFPELINWIDNLKIFDEIGRILLFFNAPNEPHSIHKDLYVGFPDNFMLINLDLDRKDIFILDDSGNRHIVRSKAFVFDPRNYHGTVGKDFYSWTLRIDGKFNKEWAESMGFWEFFKPV